MERQTRRVIKGVVTSNTNDKTIVVKVSTYKIHPKYKKRVKSDKKYYAHDENNVAHVGDVVSIMACRKMSALKRWRLVKVEKAYIDLDAQIEEVTHKEAE